MHSRIGFSGLKSAQNGRRSVFYFSPYKFEGRIGFLMELQAEFQDSAQKTTAQSRAEQI